MKLLKISGFMLAVVLLCGTTAARADVTPVNGPHSDVDAVRGRDLLEL